MKRPVLNFSMISLLLLMTRCSDFYSTSLWMFKPQGLNDERNPLTYFFGVGWNGLVIANVLACLVIVAAFYYHSFKYKLQVIPSKPKNVFQYLSLVYFNKPDKFYYLFYKLPNNWRPSFAHFGYAGIRAIIVASLLATIHNLCQFYNVNFYNSFRDAVERPLVVLYILFFLSFVGFLLQIASKEFRQTLNPTK